jgi:thioredoxin 2
MAHTYAICEKCEKLNRVEIMTNKEPICGSCQAVLPMHGAVIEATDKSLGALIAKSPFPVVVDVWAPWCGPCMAFVPTFQYASDQFLSKIVFTKLNSEINQQSAAKLGIRGIPTVLLFKDGKEVSRQSGAMPREIFIDWLKQNVATSHESVSTS